jgi:hypothetical protein
LKNAFTRIKSSVLKEFDYDNVHQFLNYVENVYVGNGTKDAVYNSEDFSLFGRCVAGEPLTTNISEGWHHGLNLGLGEPHPNFVKVLNYIKKNNNLVEFEIIRYMNDTILNKCKKVVTERTKNLQLLSINYDKIDVLIYLEMIIREYDQNN